MMAAASQIGTKHRSPNDHPAELLGASARKSLPFSAQVEKSDGCQDLRPVSFPAGIDRM